MRLQHLNESAPGKKGKTTAKDAKEFVANPENAEFVAELKKIAKKMGGVTTVIEVLKAIGTTERISENIMMSEDEIKQIMVDSGKTQVKQLLSYLKSRYDGKYDKKLAREIARELVSEM